MRQAGKGSRDRHTSPDRPARSLILTDAGCSRQP